MAYLWSRLVVVPLIALSTAVCAVISNIVALFDPSPPPQLRVAQVWAKSLVWIAGVKVEVEGLEHLDPKASFVFTSNHLSYMDTPVVLANIPAQFLFLAKEELFRIPFMGWHLKRAGHVPVPLENPRAALRTLNVSPDGIAETRWPGRIEHVSPNPDIILDGAHNPAGARALARYLERFYGGRRIWMVYGAMRDKAIEEVAGVLFPLASELILTAPDTSRALRPEALAEFAGRGHIEPNVEGAINYARTHAAQKEDADVIVITGSLFLVGEARKFFLAPTGGRWQ